MQRIASVLARFMSTATKKPKARSNFGVSHVAHKFYEGDSHAAPTEHKKAVPVAKPANPFEKAATTPSAQTKESSAEAKLA